MVSNREDEPPPLSVELVVAAYQQGIFPMADDGQVHWYTPDPRGIIDLEGFHVPKRLARTIRSGRFEMRLNQDFVGVIRACATAAPGRESTWINPDIEQVYTELHQLGLAHSVESYQDGQLVGGLYGVALGGAFMGESMFSRATDASKVALVTLVERMRACGFTLLDTQFITGHLQRFGALEISQADYLQRLSHALVQPVQLR